MKVMIIGSAVYLNEIRDHRSKLVALGHDAKMAAYDDLDVKEFGICTYNKECIRWADVVHVFWDSRSIGTQFDIGMAFALDKPIQVIKLNPKTLRNFVLQFNEYSAMGYYGEVLDIEDHKA
jgi:hypothetical protein